MSQIPSKTNVKTPINYNSIGLKSNMSFNSINQGILGAGESSERALAALAKDSGLVSSTH